MVSKQVCKSKAKPVPQLPGQTLLSFGPAKSHGVASAVQTEKAQKPQRISGCGRPPARSRAMGSGSRQPSLSRSRATTSDSPSESSVEVVVNPFTLHPRIELPQLLEVFSNEGSSCMQCSIPSMRCGPKPFFGSLLTQNRKKPVSLQHCIQGIQQIRADEECPWILEQGQYYNILSPGQRRTVVCR